VESRDRSEEAAERALASDILFVVRDVQSYPDIVDSLQRMVADGTLRGGTAMDVRSSQSAREQADSWRHVIDRARDRRSEYVVLHHFHNPSLIDPAPAIERIQALPHRPVVALTNGDAFNDGLLRPSLPSMLLGATRAVDVVFSTSMGPLADHLAKRADARVALLPHGVCQARFGAPAGPSREEPDFRVVMIGSNNRPRNPLRGYHWLARRREQLVHRLSARFGSGFGLFGHGWEGVPGWQGPIPFEQQQAACRRAEVVVGGTPFSPARYYTSDRVFIQIASGVPFVDLAVEGTDTILREGQHWHLATSLGDVVSRCEGLLARAAAERELMGVEAANFVYAHHSVEARCRSLLETLTRLRGALLAGSPPPAPDLRFLLPEVDRASEFGLATRSWGHPGESC
jgi:hypothetical protein